MKLSSARYSNATHRDARNGEIRAVHGNGCAVRTSALAIGASNGAADNMSPSPPPAAGLRSRTKADACDSQEKWRARSTRRGRLTAADFNSGALSAHDLLARKHSAVRARALWSRPSRAARWSRAYAGAHGLYGRRGEHKRTALGAWRAQKRMRQSIAASHT